MKTRIWIGLICVVCVQVAGLPEGAGCQSPAADVYRERPAGQDKPDLPALEVRWMNGKGWSSSLFFEEILRTGNPDSVGC
jgi:hypothetical protein